MKTSITLFLSGLMMLAITSCQKTKDDINDLTEFDIDYSTKVTVPSLSTGTTVAIDTSITMTTPEIPTQMASKSASAKTAISLIDQIKLTKFNISTSGSNLNFLKSLSISIKTDAADIAVATVTNIPTNVTSVSASLSDVNIKTPMTKDNMQFKITASFSSVPDSTQSSLKLDQTVHVKGKKIN